MEHMQTVNSDCTNKKIVWSAVVFCVIQRIASHLFRTIPEAYGKAEYVQSVSQEDHVILMNTFEETSCISVTSTIYSFLLKYTFK